MSDDKKSFLSFVVTTAVSATIATAAGEAARWGAEKLREKLSKRKRVSETDPSKQRSN